MDSFLTGKGWTGRPVSWQGKDPSKSKQEPTGDARLLLSCRNRGASAERLSKTSETSQGTKCDRLSFRS